MCSLYQLAGGAVGVKGTWLSLGFFHCSFPCGWQTRESRGRGGDRGCFLFCLFAFHLYFFCYCGGTVSPILGLVLGVSPKVPFPHILQYHMIAVQMGGRADQPTPVPNLHSKMLWNL